MRELHDSMDASDFMEWVAYEMTNDKDMRQKLIDEIALEASAAKAAEERAQDIKNMFKLIGA